MDKRRKSTSTPSVPSGGKPAEKSSKSTSAVSGKPVTAPKPAESPSVLFPEFKRLHSERSLGDELEVRFKWYGKKELDARAYYTALRNLNTAANLGYTVDGVLLIPPGDAPSVVSVVNSYGSGQSGEKAPYRMIDEGGKKTYQKKTEKARVPDANYSFFSALATEETIKLEDIPDKYKKNIHIRRRTRTTYIGQGVVFDFTVVNDPDNALSFEIEMEVVDENVSYEVCEIYIIFMLECIQESVHSLLVTEKEHADLRKFLASTGVSFLKQDGTYQTNYNKPEDLMMTQRGEPFFENFATTAYNITVKADGTRKFALFDGDKQNIYFVDPKSLSVMKTLGGSGGFDFDTATLIDGELVLKRLGQDPTSNRLDASRALVSDFLSAEYFEFFAFDALLIGGYQTKKEGGKIPFRLDVRSKDFTTRYSYLKTKRICSSGAENILGDAPIPGATYIYYKIFVDIIPLGLFEACRIVLDRQDLRYDQDGLIFTPIDAPYLPPGRSLTKKYKRDEDLTVDFLVKPDSSGEVRLWYDVSKGSETKFAIFSGSELFSWPVDHFELSFVEVAPDGSQREITVKHGEIAEFGYRKETKTFVPRRIRSDKNKPSHEGPTNDTWFLINRPISEETLRGKTVELMSQYHNSVKTLLLSSIQPYNRSLDIGPGRGGDLLKWKKGNLLVTAVEGDPTMIEDFEARLGDLQTSQIVLVKEYFNRDLIPRLRNDYVAVTMFNSITFFDPTEIFGLLNQVTVCNARLFVIGFDYQLFEAQIGGKTGYSSGPLSYKRSGKKVYIKIENTIVDYSENAFDYQKLFESAGAHGWTVQQNTILAERNVLGELEMMYTRSTRLLVFSRSSPILSLTVPEFERRTIL